MNRAIIIAILLVLSVGEVHAGPIWSIPAAGCVPVDTSIFNNRYLVTSATVKHQDANSDVIVLECPITNTRIDDVDRITVTYQDNDNTNTDTEVRVDLNVVDANNNTLVLQQEVWSSNVETQTSGTALTATEVFSHFVFNWFGYYYYLEVTLHRHNTDPLCINRTPCTAIVYSLLLSYGA